MADFELPSEVVSSIKGFITMLKAKPAILHKPELGFLRDYLVSLGATIPACPKTETAGGDAAPKPKAPPPSSAPDVDFEEVVEDEEPPEPYPELDMDGVVESDGINLDQEMGDPDAEVSEEAIDKSNAFKSEAVGLFSDGKYEESIAKYTDAIKLNSGSALLFAKRGQAFLKMSKPNACIKDCNRALQINPDSAVSYKFRGRAHRLLGHWVEAAVDLRQACKIDFDEQADEWLKEVTPNARKLEEYNLHKKRREEEKELKERKRRAQERARAQAEARQHQKEFEADNDGPAGGGGFGIPGLDKLFNDPEVVELFSDPEVAAAFADISQNPMNIVKYQSNPKVAKLLKLMQNKMGGMGGMPFGGMGGGMGGMPFGGMGGMPDFGGMGGMPPSAASDNAPSAPKGPNVTDDLD